MPRKLYNPNNIYGIDVERLNIFWNNYGHLYDKERQYVYRHNLLRALEAKDVPLMFLSVLSYSGALNEDKDIYNWFFNYLKSIYPNFLEKDILEVGCGETPALIKIIAEAIEKENASGSVTGMDASLVVDKIKNAFFYKEFLTYESDLTKFDTIVGIAPCEASPIALRRACFERKEIAIMLCGCLHKDKDIIFTSFDNYLNHIYRMIKQEKSSDFLFNIDYAPKNLEYEYPILSLKRK